jgi:polyphenol oxidase
MASSTLNKGFSFSKDGLFLYHQRLDAYKWLRHGFSLRRDAIDGQERSLGFNGYQAPDVVAKNRETLIQAVCQRSVPLVVLQQTHSDTVISLSHPLSSWNPIEGDGLATSLPDLMVAVQTADCPAILVVDPVQRVVAAAHAGWRGTLKRIAQKAVYLMQREFTSRPGDLVAVIGPAIRGCCYEVGEEVMAAFHNEFAGAASFFQEPQPDEATRSSTRFLDLSSAGRQQLLEAGLVEANIFADSPCTSCRRDLFFSHRAEKGNTGRLMAVIGIVSEPFMATGEAP